MAKRSVKFEDFPPEFSSVLRHMRHGRTGRKRYSDAYLTTLTFAVGRYLYVIQQANLLPAFSPETIGLFINYLDEQNFRNTTRLTYLMSIMLVAKQMDYPEQYVKMISDDLASYREEAAREPSRKRQRLAQNPITLYDVGVLARDLVKPAYKAENWSDRHGLFTTSGLLAFLSLIPLRVGDVSRLTVGENICRNHEGWIIDVSSGKSDFDSFASLHSSLTPYLDRLIHFGERDRFAEMYDKRIGSTLFIEELGEQYKPQDLSSLFKEATGHTPHIARTLVHDAMAESGQGGTDLALILCGQRTKSIAKVYEVHAKRIRVQRAQKAISQIQARLMRERKADDPNL